MRRLTIVFIILFFMVNISAQENRSISIHVSIENDVDLPLAHITINDEHLITNQNGMAYYTTSLDQIKIRVTHISHITLDTIINTSNQSVFEINLKSKNFTIDPITISDKKRLWERSKWSIQDISLHEYGFLVSAKEKSKNYIYLFDDQGIEVLKSRTKFKHSDIKKGLKTGSFHLTNKKEGMEILVSTDTIIYGKTNDIEKYEDTFNKFIFTNNQYSICEEWTQHNKRLSIIYIDNNTYEKRPFYISFDEEASIRAASVRREIIGLYYKFAADPALNLLGPGMKGENIIRDGSWSGDLYDLVISNTIQEVYTYYTSIHLKKSDISTCIKNDRLYILDDLKRSVSIYQLSSDTLHPIKKEVVIPTELRAGKFQNTNHDHELIILAEDQYFSFDIESYAFKEVDFEDQTYYSAKTSFIADNTLHVLARKSKTKYKQSIFSADLLNHN